MSFIATLLIYALYLFIIVMIIRAVFSWVSPVPTNPVSRFAWQVTEPVLAPGRRWIPPKRKTGARRRDSRSLPSRKPRASEVAALGIWVVPRVLARLVPEIS